jgi:hypothetical protein
MSANLRFFNGLLPATPPTGYTSIYVDQSDRHLKQIDDTGGTIDLTKGSGLIANKTRIINSISDLPTLVGGRCPLEAGTRYVLGDDITVANPFDISAGNILWTSNNPAGPTLQYFLTEPLFQGDDAGVFTLDKCVVVCPNALAISLADLASPNSGNLIVTEAFVLASKIAEVNALSGLVVDNVNFNADNGIEAIGTNWDVQSVARMAFFSSSPTAIAYNMGASTSSDINLSRLLINAPAGAVGISGLPNSGNILSGGSGSLRDSTFSGGVTATHGGFDPSNDVDWNARDNGPQIPNTRPGALTYQRGNLTETIITSTATPVKAAGAFSTQIESKFSVDATGRITSLSNKPITVNIEVDAVLQPVSGNSRLISLYAALNGSVIDNSRIELTISANSPKLVTIHWEETLASTDYLEVFLQNATSTDNILATAITFRVSE